MNEPQLAAWNLVGQTIGDGWNVKVRLANPRLDTAPESERTGSTFSVGYQVEKNGQTTFLKVFDIVSAFGPDRNLLDELNKITNSFQHEKALLDLCTSSHMSRVIKILDHGNIPVPFPIPGNQDYQLQLHYIVFEQADGGDIREIFNRFDHISDAVRLDFLHHVAVGLQQLHGAAISHQDLKPSNVVVFQENNIGAKIADFGRALKRGLTAAHEGFSIAGDPSYAPPEQLYNHQAPDWRDRREACDLFQLGSLVAFMFSGKNATTGIVEALPEALRPGVWTGRYEDVLPMVQLAFATFLTSIKPVFPKWAATDMETLISLACEPDVYRRGDPRARAQAGKPLGMDRFISRLNVLRSEAKRQILLSKVRPTI